MMEELHGRLMSRWKDNRIIDLKGTEWNNVE
jgi:hypothetical protein